MQISTTTPETVLIGTPTGGRTTVTLNDAGDIRLADERANILGARREGTDLVIKMRNGEELVVTGYFYAPGNLDIVVTEANGGQWLFENVMGTDQFVFEPLSATGGMSPALIAALGGGSLLAMAGGGGGGGSEPAEEGTPPDTTPPAKPTEILVSQDGTRVTGKGEPGAKVEIFGKDGVVVGSGQVSGNGSFSVTLNPPQTNGESLTVVLTDAAGNTSDKVEVAAPVVDYSDTTPPQDAKGVTISAGNTAVSGKGEAGATVKITDADGKIVAEGAVGKDGTFTVALVPPYSAGGTLNVTLVDGAGNASGQVSVVAPDLQAPDAASDLIVAAGNTAMSGKGEAGATVKVTDASGKTLGTAVVAENGQFNVTLSPAYTQGGKLTVTVVDGAGNASTGTSITAADLLAPDAPTALSVAANNGSVSGKGEAGATAKVYDAKGKELGSAVVDADGNFTVALTPAYTQGGALTVKVVDGAGNASTAGTVTAPDILAPNAPTSLSVAANNGSVSGKGEAGATAKVYDSTGKELGSAVVDAEGNFTVTLTPAYTQGGALTVKVVDGAGNASTGTSVTAADLLAPDAPTALSVAANNGSVSGKGEAGATAKVYDAKGKELGSAVVDADGNFTVALTPAYTQGGALTVKVVDGAGNASTAGTVTAPDILAPDAPTAVAVAAGNVSVSGKGEAGATAKVYDAKGKELGSAWSMPRATSPSP